MGIEENFLRVRTERDEERETNATLRGALDKALKALVTAKCMAIDCDYCNKDSRRHKISDAIVYIRGVL